MNGLASSHGAVGQRWSRQIWKRAGAGGLFSLCLCFWISATGSRWVTGGRGFAAGMRLEKPTDIRGKRIKFHPTDGLWRPEGPAPPPAKKQTDFMTTEESEQAELYKSLRQHADNGDWARALNHLHLMREDGRVPGQNAYLAGIEACNQEERWEEALQVLDAARAELRWPETHLFAAALDVLPPGRNDLVKEVMGYADLAPPSWILYEAAIAAYYRGGHMEEAKTVFRKALAEGLVQVWAQAGDLDLSQMRTEAGVVAACATVEDHSRMQLTRGAGGGFTIFTGTARRNKNKFQREVLQVLRQEYGIKIRLAPAPDGQMHITHKALQGLLPPGQAPRDAGYKQRRPKKTFFGKVGIRKQAKF